MAKRKNILEYIKSAPLFNKVFAPPTHVSGDAALAGAKGALSDEDKVMMRRMGMISSELSEMLYKTSIINFERLSLYREVDRAILYPLIGSAAEMYAEVATTFNQTHNATVWVTSSSSEYENILNKMLYNIGIEERIFDWAWNVGVFGDLFVKVIGQDGVGVYAVNDDNHPINISRLDHNGRLVGFYETPLGYRPETKELLPPWEYVHLRLLGAKKKRPMYSDPMYSEFRTINIMSQDIRRVSTRYGSSLLTNSLPVYKRLRLAEDSLMLARLSKGLLRYIYKIKVDSSNMEAVGELIDEYRTLLKRARALDTSASSPNFDEKYNPMAVNEDIIVPVWGDTNDIAIEKLGGEADIRWIVDIEELRNQLASALRIPLQILGGYASEMPSSLGQSALERLDIRFARSARRQQRALINGIKKICQIHLAYLGMSPDANLFEVNMSETSSAEEEELKDALEKGVDVVDKIADMIDKFVGNKIDKIELLDYLNQKILKLNDLDLRSMIKDDSLKVNRKKFSEATRVIKNKNDNEGDKGFKINNEMFDTDILEYKNLQRLMAKGENKKSKWDSLYESVKIESVPLDSNGRPVPVKPKKRKDKMKESEIEQHTPPA